MQPFPATGAKYQISRGGRHPLWSRDGKQLLFAIPGGNKYALADAALTRLGAAGSPQIHVVLNWFEELKRLVPATR